MIRKSSNSAASEVMRLVGPEYIAAVLQSPRYGFYDPDLGGGLWAGKEYSKAKAWRRDPVSGLSHAANALQVARFYYLLESGRLLDPDLSREMRAILSRPGVSHKIVAAIRRRFPTARFLRKSGTWRNWHSDSAVISHDGKRYVAVILVESERGESIIRDLIVRMDRIVFEVPAKCPRQASDKLLVSPETDGLTTEPANPH
jgi:beta-lactamase class A